MTTPGSLPGLKGIPIDGIFLNSISLTSELTIVLSTAAAGKAQIKIIKRDILIAVSPQIQVSLVKIAGAAAKALACCIVKS